MTPNWSKNRKTSTTVFVSLGTKLIEFVPSPNYLFAYPFGMHAGTYTRKMPFGKCVWRGIVAQKSVLVPLLVVRAKCVTTH